MDSNSLASLIALEAERLQENVEEHFSVNDYPFVGGRVGQGSTTMACLEQIAQLRRNLLRLSVMLKEQG